MEQIQLYGKNEISVYMISTKIKTIVEEGSIADLFCSYIIETFAKMPDGKRIDLVLVYNIKRFLEFFYTEEIAVEKFINDLKSPVYGVIIAHILDYNFEFVEETTLDGIKCNLYESKCGDKMYVRKQNIFSDGTYYLGGSL